MSEHIYHITKGYIPDDRELHDQHDAPATLTGSFTRKDFLTIMACSTVLTAVAIIALTMAGIL